MQVGSLLGSIRDVRRRVERLLDEPRLADCQGAAHEAHCIRATLLDVAELLRASSPVLAATDQAASIECETAVCRALLEQPAADPDCRWAGVRCDGGRADGNDAPSDGSVDDRVQAVLDRADVDSLESVPGLDLSVVDGWLVADLSEDSSGWRALFTVTVDELADIVRDVDRLCGRLRADGVATDAPVYRLWDATGTMLATLGSVLADLLSTGSFIQRQHRSDDATFSFVSTTLEHLHNS